MGNWTITIKGTGPHHNGKAFDAESVAGRTCQHLLRHGHTIQDATLVVGNGDAEPIRFDPTARPISVHVANVLKFFAFEHLPPHLQAASAPFKELAHLIINMSDNPETTVALRKILEAKDAAVRSLLPEIQ